MTLSTYPTRPTVVGSGFVALDVILGRNSSLGYFGVGGTTGNVMSILAYFGWRSVPIVKVGPDQAGSQILEELTALGVDTRYVTRDRDVETPIVYQFEGESPGMHRFTFQCPQCGRSRRFSETLLEGIDTSPHDALSGGEVYFFDRVTKLTVHMAEIARANGALTVFEPSSIGADRDLFVRALRASRVVKYSVDRISEMDQSSLEAGFIEVQTLGAAGLRFRMRSLVPQWVHLPVVQAPGVIDTSGAGDWCTAGFLHLLRGHFAEGCLSNLGYNEVYGALRASQAIAALNCRYPGARGLMRNMAPEYVLSLAKHLLREVDPRNDFIEELAAGSSEAFRSGDVVRSAEVSTPRWLCCRDLESLRTLGADRFH